MPLVRNVFREAPAGAGLVHGLLDARKRDWKAVGKTTIELWRRGRRWMGRV